MSGGIFLPYAAIEEGSNGIESFPLDSNGTAPPISPTTNITGGNSYTGTGSVIANGMFWTVNSGVPCVQAWPIGATGDTAPSIEITGDSTLLQYPSDIAIGSDGKIYVADTAGEIFVYAADANGNVAPIATISGATTTLVSPSSLALDSSDNIYVIDNDAASAPSIIKFTAGSNGDVAPATIITDSTATLTVPYCVRLDSDNNIWVSDDNVNAVYEFPADAAGSTAPTTVLNNAALVTPLWIAFDDNDNLYVLAGSSGGIVYQFAVGATGNDAPITALDASSAGTIGGLAVYGTLNVGTCIPFELQTPSQLLDEGQLAVIRRIFIDINCMVEPGFVAQTLTPIALTDLTETTLATISTSGRQTVEIAFQQSARQFSLRLTGCLTNRIELFAVELDVALTGSEVTQS